MAVKTERERERERKKKFRSYSVHARMFGIVQASVGDTRSSSDQ